jgi:hypothetical protein
MRSEIGFKEVMTYKRPTALGGRWGSIYSPHLKRVVGGNLPPDKFGGALWKPTKVSGNRSQTELVRSTGQVR